MEIFTEVIEKMSHSALARTQKFFLDEMNIVSFWPVPAAKDVNFLTLYDLTVLVYVSGLSDVIIAVSFESPLLDEMLSRFTADIAVTVNQKELYRRESAAEIVNIIVGHCTIDLQNSNRLISISPPVIVEEAKTIHRPAEGVFKRLSLGTEYGRLDIYFVGPCALFDECMNVIDNSET